MVRPRALTYLWPLLLAGGDAFAGVTQGTLVTKSGDRIVEVPLEHTAVDIRVSGPIASVRVVQRFTNPYPRKIEAIYAFPLPPGAAVDHFTLRTGDEVIRGELRRRAEAKRIYARAKALGHIAALLEEERPGAFTQSVANLEPGAKLEVELHYVEALQHEDDRWELAFPMVITPRPISARSKIAPRFLPPDVRSSHDISLAVHLAPGLPLRSLSSPSHRIEVRAEDGARVELAGDDTVPNKDFVLRWSHAGEAPAAAVLADPDRRSFLLTVQPPGARALATTAPRELVFAIDTSSSMAGAPLAKARQLVRRGLAGLAPDDTFQIVAFSDHAVPLGAAPIASTDANRALANRWLELLEACGGTEMIAGIEAALVPPHDPSRLRLVVFISDGYVGDEPAILRAVHERLGASRIFPFGVGSAVNRYLLEEMAALGRGAVTVLRTDEDESAAIERLHARIARPVLTELSVDWGGLAVESVAPARLPDLFAGQPLQVAGRYTEPGRATVRIRGRILGRMVELPVEVELPASGVARPELGTLWAGARIRELERELLRRDAPELVEALTALALEHGVLTPYTAFVAVSERRTKPGTARVVPVPVEAPEGLTQVHAVGHAVGHGAPAATRFYPLALHKTEVPVSVPVAGGMVAGSFDRDLVHRTLANHRGAIKHCYEKRLTSRPGLTGRLSLHFEIAPSGAVSEVRISESTLDDPQVEQCVLERVRQMSFPSAAGAGAVEVNMPYVFRFEPGGAK